MLFTQIAQNKRNTRWVLVGYGLLLIAITILFAQVSWQVALGFALFGLGYVWYFYYHATRYLMRVTNAQAVSRADAPVLYELVEELCLAGGLPMPALYVTPDEEPNAFATGRDPEHASLAVTAGLLAMMDQEELRGVIGHELAHIRNYDIRVTTLTAALVQLVLLTGVTLVAFGWGLFASRVGGWLKLVLVIFGVAVLGLGLPLLVLGFPLAKLMFFALSRQREYLADAGSADLTRDPRGLISALQKLAALPAPGEATNLVVNSLAFNAAPPQRWWANLLADHPALEKRIARLLASAQ